MNSQTSILGLIRTDYTLIIVFLVILLLFFLLTGGFAYFQLNQLNDDVDEMNKRSIEAQKTIDKTEADIAAATILTNIVVNRGEILQQAAIDTITALCEEYVFLFPTFPVPDFCVPYLEGLITIPS